MKMLGKSVYGKGRHKMQFAPMVDCVFLLLIFFLVACQVRPTEGDFDTKVPAGRGQADVKMEQKNIINVWVADLGDEQVEIRVGQRLILNFKALKLELESMGGKDSVVVIDGPPDVSIQTITDAMDAVVLAGIPSMTFMDPEMKAIQTGRIPLSPMSRN